MSAPLLAAAVLLMGLVIFWYVQDETTRGGQGKSGLLGMVDPPAKADPSAGAKWKRSTTSRPWRIGRR
jgi:hypothetical protein